MKRARSNSAPNGSSNGHRPKSAKKGKNGNGDLAARFY